MFIFLTCRIGATQRSDSGSQSSPEPPKPQPSFGFNLFTRQLLSNEKFRALKGNDRDQQLLTRWEQLSDKEIHEFDIEVEKV